MEYKKEFKVSEITDIKPSENSNEDLYEWAKKRCKSTFLMLLGNLSPIILYQI